MPTGQDSHKSTNTTSSDDTPGRGKSHTRRSMASQVCLLRRLRRKTDSNFDASIGRLKTNSIASEMSSSMKTHHRHEPAAFHTSWRRCETPPFPSYDSLGAQNSRKHYESSLTDLNSQLTLFTDNS